MISMELKSLRLLKEQILNIKNSMLLVITDYKNTVARIGNDWSTLFQEGLS